MTGFFSLIRVARYYTDRVDALIRILTQYRDGIDEDAPHLIAVTAERLLFVDARWIRAVSGGAVVGVAVCALRSVFNV